jgi:putative endonuclease
VTNRRRRLGDRGEAAVAEWYRARGGTVLERNWRCAEGELDLVVLEGGGDVVVFCEVKTRSGSTFGSPLEAVTPAKARRLRRLAGRWMSEARPPGVTPDRLRVDVAAVRTGPAGAPVVEVVEDAC